MKQEDSPMTLAAVEFAEQSEIDVIEREGATGPGGRAVRLSTHRGWIRHQVALRPGLWRITIRGAGFDHDKNACWLKLNHQRGEHILRHHLGRWILFSIHGSWDERSIEVLVDTPVLRLKLGPGKAGTVVDSIKLERIEPAAREAGPLPKVRAMDSETDIVIPQPQEIVFAGAQMTLDDGAAVILSPGAAERERETARIFRDALWNRLGIGLRVVEVGDPAAKEKSTGRQAASGTAIRVGLIDDEGLRDLAQDTAGHGEEAYALEVNAGGARLAGAASAGLFYGVMTLVQLAREHPAGSGVSIPGVRVKDWPALSNEVRVYCNAPLHC